MRETKSSNSVLRIRRESSIELEPRTLTLDQLRYAREAALYVLSTKTIEEAIGIFTEGLQPVLSIKGTMELRKELNGTNHQPKEHSSLPQFAEMRDIVSAPF